MRINSLQTKADSTETALLQQIVLLASDYYTAAVVDGYLALKANVADVYSKTAADLLLADKATTGEVALKADQTEVDSIEASLLADIVNLATNYWTAATTKAYIDGTDEIQAAAIALKANSADVYDTAAINLLLADKADTGSVAIVSGALAAHTGEVSGAHQGTAIAVDSSGFTGNLKLADDTVQKALATLDALSGLPATNAITKIYGDADVDGCDTGAVWLVGTNGVTVNRTSNTFEVNIDSATKFGGYYTKAETNATIEAAIAAIPAPSVNQTVTVQAGEALTAGQVVSLINENGTMKAYNNPLTVSTSPNGAESVFNSAATTYCSAVALDSTRFLVAYVDSDGQGRSIVGTVTGSTIAWGSESLPFFSSTTWLSACLVSTDKVLIAARNGAGDGTGKMVVCTISTATITVGSEADFRSANVNNVKVSQLDVDTAILCYRDQDDSKLRGKVVTISTTTPTPYPAAGTNGTELDAGPVEYVSLASLSSTSAIVAYRDGGNSNYGTAQVLSISGTTITAGTEYVLPSSRKISANKIDKLSSTSAFWFYADNDTGYGYARVCSISNETEISYGTEKTVFSGVTYVPVCHNIDGTKVLLGYEDGTTGGVPYEGRSALASISGTNIDIGTVYTYNTVGMSGLSSCYLGSNKSIFAYTSTGNSSYGTAVVNQWATTSYASVSGISSGAYSSGSDAVVLISGVSNDQSGLITGSPYFLQSDFTIGTTPVSLTSSVYSSAATTREIKIGTAKSATELIIGIDYK